MNWVKVHLIRDHSFWDLPIPSNCSWTWRKLLQLRAEVRPFIRHIIGDGRHTSLWFDTWLPFGPILPQFEERVIYDSALLRQAKVASIITNGRWMWPIANSPDLLILKQAIPFTMVPDVSKGDEVIWSYSKSGRYSTNLAWLALRDRHSLVTWHKLIWFPKAIPKCGFILWLAIRERLGTLDRLHVASSGWTCFLCNSCVENHEHLFFSCSYSNLIWRDLKQKGDISFGDLSWRDCISQMVALCKGKSLTSMVRKLCFATRVYLIWEERNRRLHDNSLREAKAVLWSITDLIRHRLYALRGIQDNEVNHTIQSTWRLPESIFT